MRISDTLVKELLLKSDKVSEEQINSVREQSGDSKSPLQDLVIKANII